MMTKTVLMTGAIALSILSTGCATKKYVAKTVAPVETRVSGAETKNTDQDKQIAGQAKQLEDLDRGLSRTNEKLADTDQKAVTAGQNAQQAGMKADGAQKSADGARSLAEQGIQKTDQLAKNFNHAMDSMNKYQMAKAITVQFPVNQSKLSKEAKSELDDFSKEVTGKERYVVEIQGFTDKTGSAAVNEALSQARAEEVARYLANNHMVPLRSISMLGSGYAMPVADDKTRAGRKQNRRVEIRLFVPESASANLSAQAQP